MCDQYLKIDGLHLRMSEFIINAVRNPAYEENSVNEKVSLPL